MRQRGVRLLAAGQGVPARVLDARFLGDIALVEVAVQGLDAPLFARVKESDVPPQGAEIGVGIDTGACWCSRRRTAIGRRCNRLDASYGEAGSSLRAGGLLLP